MDIHPSAVISPQAELDQSVKIGPFSIIGDKVRIGQSTEIKSHVVIQGWTQIGEGNIIYPFVTIGTPPQDIGYKGEDTRIIIGQENIFREYTTIHRATTKEEWMTSIGDSNYLMAYSHVAHDCRLGNHIIMNNAATLGGHVKVEDFSTVGALSAVHQFVRIGAHAFIGGKTGVPQDIPPYMLAAGERARLYGVNQKGLIRQGFSQKTIDGLKKAFHILWRKNKKFSDGLEQINRELEMFPELERLLRFISDNQRGITR
jgi:UDP-N-acetylglucosamine acyltransferase